VNESVGRMADFKHANVPSLGSFTTHQLGARTYILLCSRRPACWPHASSYVDLEPPRACRCLVCGRVLTSQTETRVQNRTSRLVNAMSRCRRCPRSDTIVRVWRSCGALVLAWEPRAGAAYEEFDICM
jgi:hypothetical protein